MSEIWSKTYIGHILIKLEFYRQIFEITQISNFMKIRPVTAELFHADGGTTKKIAVFRNFANAPKKESRTKLTKSSFKQQRFIAVPIN